MDQPVKKFQKKRQDRSSEHDLMIFGKVPPQSKELEQAVLGAIMLDKDAYDEAAQILKPEFFYVESHRKVFGAMKALAEKNYPIDLLTVVEQLKTTEDLELVGGEYAVAKLTNAVVSSANIQTHSIIVADKYLKRELIRVTGELHSMAYDDTVFGKDLIETAERIVGEIGLNNLEGGMIGIETVIHQAVGKIEEWRQQDSSVTGIPSGFPELDRATRGWQPGDLIVIAARPSVGKTAFALNIVRAAADHLEIQGAVAAWSLEMKAVFLALRMLSAESEILLYNLQTGKITDEQMADLMNKAAKKLSSLPIFFDESTHITLQSLSRKARRLKKKNKLKLIVVDYLQLMSSDEKGGNREQEISKISRGLKNLAQELDVPVIALSQLSREMGSKNISWDYGPPISSIRESGAVEQDADVIIMLWGPSDEDIQKNRDLVGKRKVRVAKQRNGVLITEELNFKNEIQLFEVLEEKTGISSGSWRPLKKLELSTPDFVRDFSEPKSDREDDLPF